MKHCTVHYNFLSWPFLLSSLLLRRQGGGEGGGGRGLESYLIFFFSFYPLSSQSHFCPLYQSLALAHPHPLRPKSNPGMTLRFVVCVQTFNVFSFSVAVGSACDSTNGGCQQICVNRTGLVTCYCNSGYNLTNDGKMCTGI